ncbi:P-loop containing nucleoside triphosphate hydrolase protein [Mycena latifolia]|nr:P-loop containing nucleoside triphosphate hydrolase protein [Mycena latifolia]
MPQHFTSIPDSILQYTLVAADALQDVATAAQIPFLKSVCSLTVAIIPMIENMKFQKDRCLRMAEDNHRLLCALMALCLYSTNISSPQMLDQIAQCAETLENFHACLTAQNELGTIRRFFKQSEITVQLDACERELNLFTTQFGVGIASVLVEMNIDTERRHQELLELISARSRLITASASTRGSSFNDSSGSLSLLPASPKIFHGRDSELNDLIRSLLAESPRVAVLGPGGMGKTALAMAALHHPTMIEKYNLRHFISCESANTDVELVSIVGAYLGFEPSKQLYQAIVRHFEGSGPCLLVLDNLETPWEALESRGKVEEFLISLADVPSLALLITMRGAERPCKVKWTRPFLPPLEPLPPLASRQIFAEIADNPDIGEESALEELLHLSGSLPLAISLMASIAAFEGYTSTLSRWTVENTTLLSDGHDKRSNLEMSISLSLGSPRFSSSPDAKILLSLLSILPDGITDEDLIISKVPLLNVPHSRASLVRTSLAYVDGGGRLKALSPIREYIRRVHPPSVSLSRPLRTYFQEQFTIWDTFRQLPSADLVPKMVSHLGNINGLMLQGLIDDEAALSNIGHSILTLNNFSITMLKGNSSLTQHLSGVIERTGDSRLRWSDICAYLRRKIPPFVAAERLIADGLEHFNTVQCNIEEDSTESPGKQFYTSSSSTFLVSKTV